MDKSPDAFRTISEVADFLETPAHVLRFWESRFPQIKPVKRAGGRRYYRPADVALLAGIRQLLHQDGMTIRGVQKILRDQGVRHVINLSDPGFSEAFDAEAEGDAVEESGTDFPQIPSALADEPNNIVSLTEWRPAEDTVPASPEAQALDETAAPDGVTEAPLAAPLAGASLAAEPETLPRTPPMNSVQDEDELPLQWSLFDLDPEPLPHSDGGEDRAVAILSDDLTDATSQDANLDEALSDSLSLVPSDQSASDSPAPEAEASPAAEMASPEPEALSPPIEDVAALAPISSAEDVSTAADRPWLPPRLRALQAQDAAAQQALPRAELLTLLQRARSLLGGLKDGVQIPRG